MQPNRLNWLALDGVLGGQLTASTCMFLVSSIIHAWWYQHCSKYKPGAASVLPLSSHESFQHAKTWYALAVMGSLHGIVMDM